MFRVPDAVAGNHLGIETPWGRRTKPAPFQLGPDGLIAKVRVPKDGLVVTVNPPPKVARTAQTSPVRVTVKNTGQSTVSGYRPQIGLQWGTFRTPWQRRTGKEVDLPAEWGSFSPGQTRTFSVDIPVPSVAEDYSVFAIFNLFESADGDTLAGGGSHYSDSRLLRVR
jgi:hypothetical protein